VATLCFPQYSEMPYITRPLGLILLVGWFIGMPLVLAYEERDDIRVVTQPRGEEE